MENKEQSIETFCEEQEVTKEMLKQENGKLRDGNRQLLDCLREKRIKINRLEAELEYFHKLAMNLSKIKRQL